MIFNTFNVLANVFDAIQNNIPLLDVVDDKKKRDILSTDGNVSELLGTYIIEPSFIISESLQNNDKIKNVISMNMDLFVSTFTKAFTTLVEIKGLEVDTAFKLLSSRDSMTMVGKMGQALESDALYNSKQANGFMKLGLTQESSDNDKQAKIAAYKQRIAKKRRMKKGSDDKNESNIKLTNNPKTTYSGPNVGIESNDKKYLDRLNMVHREIGITFMVNKDGVGYRVNMTVLVRASIKYVSNRDIALLLDSTDGYDTRFMQRFDMKRAKLITWSDLIFANDLVADYKNKRLRDSKELLKDLEKRVRRANSKLADAGAVGFSKYYQHLIIDSQLKAMLEKKIGAKLTSKRGKEILLEQLKSFAVNVVDEHTENVMVAVKGLDGTSMLRYKDLKSDGKDDDVKDMLKFLAQRTI